MLSGVHHCEFTILATEPPADGEQDGTASVGGVVVGVARESAAAAATGMLSLQDSILRSSEGRRLAGPREGH